MRATGVLALTLVLAAGVRAQPPAYEVGGPLEGPKLPLFPTQHGEPVGFPGVLAGAPDGEPTGSDGNRAWTPQDQWPQRQLYPGSVENWRGYWGKYVPVRSMFDAGSLLKKWVAPQIPGAAEAQVEQYAAPLYWVPRHATPQPTGKFNAPVAVVRATPGASFELDLGELPVGLYSIRVVGAVPTPELRFYRQPIYLRLAVNDGNQGEQSHYRMQIGYVDDFYSVAEFYFHAPAKRRYRAVLSSEQTSQTALLVQSIDLHDALAGTVRRPIKKGMTLAQRPQRPAAAAPADMDKRLELDATIWQSLPPLNAQLGGHYGPNKGYHGAVAFGHGGKTLAEIEAEHGKWEMPRQPLTPVLLENKQLGLKYTTADLAAHKPLPDPYPIKDNGLGVYTPVAGTASANPPGKGEPQDQHFTVVADAAVKRINPFYRALRDNAQRYHHSGDAEAGWTAAVQLIRAAWQYPTLDGAQALGAVVTHPAGFTGEQRNRRRMPISPGGGGGLGISDLLHAYDQVFDLIQGNEALAQSAARFIPWVKGPDDLIMLLDVYLVQYQAKQVLRYNMLSDNDPAKIATPAAVLADRGVTDPWMAWLFAKGYVYPNPPSGLADMLISGNDRDGTGYIASWFYVGGEQAGPVGSYMDAYIRSGGDRKYDLSDPRAFPKVPASAYFSLRSRIAGLHFPRIGDVCGPDKAYAASFDMVTTGAERGWRWTKDPQFAWVLQHMVGRKDQSDAEWAAIEQAAVGVKRAPWMENRSRVLINWFGLLESGHQHDDFRFRRNVMLRIGQGYGHEHNDTLDVQITAHGLPMTIDGGQRRGYSRPEDLTTRLHNLVEVDGKEWLGHSWVRTLSDTEGARYLLAEAVPPRNHRNVKLYQRQVALVDVDEGQGARPLTPEQFKPDAKLPTDVITPNSYIFDVVRVSGGKLHTYAFHGALEDELVTNVSGQQPYEELSEEERDYVKIFRDEPIEGYPTQPLRWGGNAPETLEATWRMAREIPGTGKGEKQMAPGIWSEDAPRKYTRLHLLDQQGSRVLTGWAWCRQWKYGSNQLYTQQRGEQDRDVVFPALIEPFAGQPFIVSRRLLEVADNDGDARRAVAVEIKTVNGHTDVLLADGRPEKRRRAGEIQFAGEFACYSTDAQGLRLASLTGGTELRGPELVLTTAGRERTGTVVRAGYEDRVLEIEPAGPAWPLNAAAAGRVLEIGSADHLTTYTLEGAASAGGNVLMTTQGGADLFLARVLEVDAGQRQVRTTIGLPMLAGTPCPGFDRNLVASNQEGTKFWRARYLGKAPEPTVRAYVFELDAPVSEADFAASGGLRLWEYGVGDTVRQSTFAHLQRIGEGRYKLTADVDLTLQLKGQALETSTDGEQWRPAAARAQGPWLSLEVPAGQTGGQALYLRVTR